MTGVESKRRNFPEQHHRHTGHHRQHEQHRLHPAVHPTPTLHLEIKATSSLSSILQQLLKPSQANSF